MTLLLVLAVISFLIFVTGFYVAAEFSAVSVSRPRLAQMAEEGNRSAQYVLEVVESPRDLDAFVAACQVGITVSSLGLGYYGQARLLDLLSPMIDQLPATLRAFLSPLAPFAILLILTILSVILGELLPKNVGLLHAEELAVLTGPGMHWSVRILRPLIWLFNGSGQLILRVLGASTVFEHTHVHSRAEIEILVEESSAGGVLDEEERRLLINTIRLRDMTAHKVMIPRNRMLVAPVSSSCEELFALLANSPYSRLPLFEGTIDSIVGVIHLKELMQAIYAPEHATDERAATPRDCMHAVLYVPETAHVDEVMNRMQAEHHNLAIVVDEYGGTAGMITLEDLVEEIVGEFHDEFDIDSPAVEVLPDGRLRVRGDVSLDDLAELLGVNVPDTDVDSVGGLVLVALGRIPKAGETVNVANLSIRVDRVAGNRIVSVSIPISDEQAALVQNRLKDL